MIRIRDERPRSYFREIRNHFFGVKILKFFDADPGWKKIGSGMEKIHPGSATLVRRNKTVYKYDAKFQSFDTSQPRSLTLRNKMLSCVYLYWTYCMTPCVHRRPGIRDAAKRAHVPGAPVLPPPLHVWHTLHRLPLDHLHSRHRSVNQAIMGQLNQAIMGPLSQASMGPLNQAIMGLLNQQSWDP